MKENKGSCKRIRRQWIPVLFYLLTGAACGLVMALYLLSDGDRPLWQDLLAILGLYLLIYVGLFFQTVVHEAGHLVFGLLSGYQFSSFRVMSLMVVREGGKLRLKRLTIAGTGGQCLMTPPDPVDGKYPVVLYNLGGSLMNLLASAALLCLALALGGTNLLAATLLVVAVIGFASAILNGVPMRMAHADNDGRNALSLRRSPAAMRAFWIQLKVNEQIARGVRLKDMPDAWFAVPTDEEMKNTVVSVMGVFACNRLMDAQRFEEADAFMARLLSIDSGMAGLHRSLMVCDRMFCELIAQNRREVLTAMRTEEQRKFMKSMKKFPSVLRTEYACALLAEGDRDRAEQLQAQFETCAKAYPYPSDIQSERELMEIAETRALPGAARAGEADG